MTGTFALRNAAYWGLASIASAFSFWILTAFFLHPGFPLGLWRVLLDAEIILYIVTFIMHVYGYATLGKRASSPLLFWSASLMMLILVIFGILIIMAVQSGPSGANSILINAFIGVDITAFALVALVFAYALFKAIRFAALPVLLFTLAIISLWTPWLTALLFIPSTYFLFIQSQRQNSMD